MSQALQSPLSEYKGFHLTFLLLFISLIELTITVYKFILTDNIILCTDDKLIPIHVGIGTQHALIPSISRGSFSARVIRI